MKRKEVIRTLLLSLAALGSFYWVQNQNLQNYTLQALALVVILYFILQFASRSTEKIKLWQKSLDIFAMSLIVFLTVFSTGGLESPLFFLIYFLLFGISLLFEPISSVFISLVLVGLFLLSRETSLANSLIQLSSLFLITPLAVILGKNYVKLLSDEEEIGVLKEEEKVLEKALDEKEEEVKTWKNEELRERLIEIWEDLDALEEEGLPNKSQKKLQKISDRLGKILQSAEDLEDEMKS